MKIPASLGSPPLRSAAPTPPASKPSVPPDQVSLGGSPSPEPSRLKAWATRHPGAVKTALTAGGALVGGLSAVGNVVIGATLGPLGVVLGALQMLGGNDKSTSSGSLMMLGGAGALALGGVLGGVAVGAAVLGGAGLALSWAMSGHQLGQRLSASNH